MSEKEKNNFLPRPPIVVVLGHVDHGKTTLLDYIRKTKIAEKESGGITQSIGAYEVEVNNKKITFIDTPGHEAFTSLRSRGAKTADLAILVVAADEGIKPQTLESVQIISKAQIPYIVALTKIDKPEANPEKVKRELVAKGIYLEKWGGDIPWVEVSSKTGQGIDELLEMIILMGEMIGLKGDKNLPASGFVLESYLDSKRGPTAVLIITNGTLRQKDLIMAGNVYGKVKILENFLGQSLKEATFSSPVRIIGFEDIPEVGSEFFAAKNQEELEQIKMLVKTEKGKNISTLKIIGDPNSQIQIPLIIKADSQGSYEALEFLIDKLGKNQQWCFNLIYSGIGDITEGDLKIANPLGTLVIGFRVKKRPETITLIKNNPSLVIIEEDIVYNIEQKVKEITEKRFIEKPEEQIIGQLEVLSVFNPSKGYQIIGGKVLEGEILLKSRFHLIRNEEIIGEGKVVNLQQNKMDVKTVKVNQECGLMVECSKEIKVGDKLEFFQKIS